MASDRLEARLQQAVVVVVMVMVRMVMLSARIVHRTAAHRHPLRTATGWGGQSP